ncbi:MAG: hypothetical protein AAB726_01430 [Patescibacteria group bacterium]
MDNEFVPRQCGNHFALVGHNTFISFAAGIEDLARASVGNKRRE